MLIGQDESLDWRPLVGVPELGHVLLDVVRRLLLDGVGELEVFDPFAATAFFCEEVIGELE